MDIDSIAIWVHPLWSTIDLGERTANFWRKNINRFASNEKYGFILVGQPTNYCSNEEWAARIVPMIENLPSQFGSRYIRWPENYVNSQDINHVRKVCRQFEMKEPEFFNGKYPKGPIFNEARIDGLIPGPNFCVGEQVRQIAYLIRAFETKYWQNS